MQLHGPTTLEVPLADCAHNVERKGFFLVWSSRNAPARIVKDLRTGVEKGNAQGVLDGDLDDYLEAALAQRVEGGSGEAIEDID